MICKGPQTPEDGRERAYSHCLLTPEGPWLESGGPRGGADPTWPLTNLPDCLKDLVLLAEALLNELGVLSLPEFQTPFKLKFLQHLLFLQERRSW